MGDQDDRGIVQLRSSHAWGETLERLRELVKARGLAIVAEVDHSGAAAKAGLSMRPSVLVIFGNAKSGTPLMVASPSLALDLPLKVLVSEDKEGTVWVSYNSPGYLQQRHDVPEELMRNIAGIEAIAEEVVR